MGKFIDITGEVFNRLTVVRRSGKNKRGAILWECRCICGNTVHVLGAMLKSGNTKSCGCIGRERLVARNKSIIKDISGQTFGRLTAIRMIGYGENGRIAWECSCSCGNTTTADGSLLRIGRVQSCGCLKVDCNTTHGMTGTKTFRSWASMKQRCNNQNNKDYHHYGGRGITYDPRWEYFENFLEDMGEKPHPNLTIERIDNNGNYEPGNCRWATQLEQTYNKRVNHYISHNSETKTLTEWADEFRMWPSTLLKRINKLGVDKAFEKAEEGKHKYVKRRNTSV